MRGVPLRFSDALDLIEADTKFPKQFRHNRASVDSELSLLPGPPGLSMTALIPNPYFDGRLVSEDEKHRVIQVSRLDGPTRQDVISLIDRTLKAEQEGLAGRAYIGWSSCKRRSVDEGSRGAFKGCLFRYRI